MEKIAVIMRGVPGSGKSTVTNILKGLYKPTDIAVHSTDDYFMLPNTFIDWINSIVGKPYKVAYKWKQSKMHWAHKRNQRAFGMSIVNKISCIICDNTNLNQKEYKPYVEIAKTNGYTIVAIVFETNAIDIHINRNVHKVPTEAIVDMIYKLNNNKTTAGADELITITAQMPLEEVKKVITEKFIRYCN
jgi:predicted kinase